LNVVDTGYCDVGTDIMNERSLPLSTLSISFSAKNGLKKRDQRISPHKFEGKESREERYIEEE